MAEGVIPSGTEDEIKGKFLVYEERGRYMAEVNGKVMSAREAVERFVHDGDELVIGNYTVGSCAELVYEITRQGKKGFTLYSQSGIFDVEVLVAGGCVERLVSTYVMRSGGKKGGSAVERALNAGTLQIEDYTNFEYNARLVAGMHGFSFMPVLEGVMVTDIFRRRGFMGENKFRIIKCPYTGKEKLTVPAAEPDVCVIHVQRADSEGNAQYWGAMGSVAAAALASKKIIVSCEEIVDHGIIESSPHLTIIPGYRVNAVVEVPWGAHPTEVLGYYNVDTFMYNSLFTAAAATASGLQAWMEEWVYGCPDRAHYIDHYIAKFGSETLDELRAKPFYSAPADYGAAFTSHWDREGRERSMGVTLPELEQLLKERGKVYG
ncbi:MAG: CoA transferase subunit A [Deltaproteobacteria bacterium]|nr:CoA transferase subunit A [Deltaproteobacteria bacterium]